MFIESFLSARQLRGNACFSLYLDLGGGLPGLCACMLRLGTKAMDLRRGVTTSLLSGGDSVRLGFQTLIRVVQLGTHPLLSFFAHARKLFFHALAVGLRCIPQTRELRFQVFARLLRGLGTISFFDQTCLSLRDGSLNVALSLLANPLSIHLRLPSGLLRLRAQLFQLCGRLVSCGLSLGGALRLF